MTSEQPVTRRRRAGMPPSGHVRLGTAVAVGVFAAVLAQFLVDPAVSILVGVVCLSVCFVVFSLAVLWPMSGERTRENASREDIRPLLEEVPVVVMAVVNLVFVVLVLVGGGSGDRTAGALLGLVGIFFTWAMLHLMYATRYAHEYYRSSSALPQLVADRPYRGGIDFNTDQPPCYVDFLYFAFNLGMTFQVSDTDVSTTRLRSIILRHCLLSYVFSTVLLAAAVNLVVGVLPS